MLNPQAVSGPCKVKVGLLQSLLAAAMGAWADHCRQEKARRDLRGLGFRMGLGGFEVGCGEG